jgi:hypothetical protein
LKEVTSIVSCNLQPHEQSVVNYQVQPPEGLCHWQISLEDSESANLLAELPAAVQWLQRALRQKGSKVLVHCNAGAAAAPIVREATHRAAGLMQRTYTRNVSCASCKQPTTAPGTEQR